MIILYYYSYYVYDSINAIENVNTIITYILLLDH